MNKSETLFQGKIFSVERKEMMVAGRPVLRDIVVHSGGAAVCAVLDHRILLVRQSRAGVNELTLEIPAGMIEPGEDPAPAAMRELNEEAGIESDHLDLITAFWPTPGYDTEVIYVYQARNIRKVKTRLPMDDSEDITICWMDLDEAYQKICTGEIRDGKTILAIYHSLLEERK